MYILEKMSIAGLWERADSTINGKKIGPGMKKPSSHPALIPSK
jgi:hypothetical protein